MEFLNLHALTGAWHWSVSGIIIALIMLTLVLFGKSFGLSSTYQTMCAMLGAGETTPFFRFDWKARAWNLYFAGGIIAGGFLAGHFLSPAQTVEINPDTQSFLLGLGLIEKTGADQRFPLLPEQLFGHHASTYTVIIVIGGLLSGFGARYAGGCTSGHFISGLSNLQIPSFITVAFFILGGVVSTNILLPFLLNHL